MYKRQGVPKGYKHKWTYRGNWNEKKIKKGLWKIDFKATKTRQGAKGWGTFGRGTKGAWYIKGIQYIKKTGINKYQTRLIGTKKPLRFYIKKSYSRQKSRRTYY